MEVAEAMKAHSMRVYLVEHGHILAQGVVQFDVCAARLPRPHLLIVLRRCARLFTVRDVPCYADVVPVQHLASLRFLMTGLPTSRFCAAMALWIQG